MRKFFYVVFIATFAFIGCNKEEIDIHQLITDRQIDEAIWAIRQGIDVNEKDKNGNAPLHFAVFYPQIVNMLIINNVDIELTNSAGNTPLLVAAQWAQIETSQLLIDAGADVNAKNEDGETPLHLTAYYGYTQLMSIYLSNGADMSITDKTGDAPLHEAAIGDQTGTAKILLEWGAEPNPLNRDGATPLDYADDEELIRLLESYGGKSGLEPPTLIL